MRKILVWLGVMVWLGFSSCATQPGTPVCLAGATLDEGGQCVAQRAAVHYLPFREGYKTFVSQAFHGAQTHKGYDAFSVDFECEEGDPIVASRSGRVWDVREDSNHGCADPACSEDSNYVIIDHGDGTYSSYHHLRYLGAMVERGQKVCAGQVIGMCGATGYATAPHLHYSLTDSRRTLPLRFVEGYHQKGNGVPVARTRYVSENKLRAQCSVNDWSELGRGAFLHQGIELDQSLSLVLKPSSRTVVSGRLFGDQPKVAVHRRSADSGTWISECVDKGPNGEFSVIIDWPARRFPSGRYLMMMTGADSACYEASWAWSYGVQVLP